MPPMETSHVADEGNDGGADESVKVFVRIRPLNKREIAEKQTIGWDFNETSMLEDTQNGQRVYAYDHCFGPNGTNKETYEIVGKPVVLKAMEGYNGTVFTYGQTGSGKTWTMRGCESDPGMMILCIRDIMNWVKDHPHIKYTLKVSYLEVYNEEINDLLGEGADAKNLKIVSEDSVRGAVIGGLVEEIAQTPEDFMAILKRGEASRSYASTEMNNESSRSHTIYRVTIESVDIPEDGSPPTGGGKVAYLNLVDLAGSERQKSTKAEGKTLKEGSNINKSLLALGAVINKLGELSKKQNKGAKPQFIPYRDSKLTRILKQSLGGNTLTSMLCAVTPAPMHREETVSTLKFGQLCKSIKNSVKSNEAGVDDKTLMKQYRSTIADLKAKLEAASKGILSADPDTALGQALQEKVELENKVRSLEAVVIAGGGSLSLDGSGGAGAAAAAEAALELARLTQQVAEQNELIHELQHNLEEYTDWEESKAAFEEYQHHSTQELDEGLAKLEEEKQTLQNERYKMLKDRSNIDEKESRIGLLITNLDEKESKLRQMMGTMKEQQDQWQRSITDLKRREDLVDDWQTNHTQREKRLQETDAMQERKFAELNKREADLSAEEQKFKIAEKELKEREARLQVALSRVSNSEQTMAALEDKLNNYEQQLKKRENDSDIRDRELLSRRKEMESWDVLLREKDRKISVEQRNLDEREAAVRATEEKVRQRDIESERRLLDLRQNEAAVAEQQEACTKLQAEVEERDVSTTEQMRLSNILKEELFNKENELNELERKLLKLQERMSGIEQRETELKQRIAHHKGVEDEFFNVKVAQITSRHGKELSRLENIVSTQLKIAADFQRELDAARAEIAQKTAQIEDFEVAMEQRNSLIEQLREHLSQSDMASANTYDSGLESGRGEGDSSDEEDDNESHDGRTHVTHHTAHTAHTAHTSHTAHSAHASHANHAPLSSSSRAAGGSSQHNLLAAAQAAMSASKNDHYGSGNNGGGGSNKKLSAGVVGSNAAPTGQELIIQLATTRKMLRNILEKHDAVPDRNTSWGRRNGRNSLSTGNSPLQAPRGSVPPTTQGTAPHHNNHATSNGTGHNAAESVAVAGPAGGFSSPQQQQGGDDLGSESGDSYGPVQTVNHASDIYGTIPSRETPHQFSRQSVSNLSSVPSIDATAQAATASGISPMNRQSSFVYNNNNGNYNNGAQVLQDSPLTPMRRQASAQLSGFAAAMQEEKEESSVRSKRNPILTTPTAPAATALSAQGYNLSNSVGRTTPAEAADRPSYSPSGMRHSPYTGSYSPNLSNLVKTGERRNGVPVTTVNLGYSSGIKRGASFRDSVNSPKKN